MADRALSAGAAGMARNAGDPGVPSCCILRRALRLLNAGQAQYDDARQRNSSML